MVPASRTPLSNLRPLEVRPTRAVLKLQEQSHNMSGLAQLQCLDPALDSPVLEAKSLKALHQTLGGTQPPPPARSTC
ncbi:hypothetical protein P7K49_012123 [Saguinus oedipus]|uniref:Uncharacterized protein n=1 Tax=Saguinus oedipus TaxID=9490 RepID=A0ABQ9VSK2_SAGOE|nr:hypothetical protein P7K49_012123 [Saguinus oedipus]